MYLSSNVLFLYLNTPLSNWLLKTIKTFVKFCDTLFIETCLDLKAVKKNDFRFNELKNDYQGIVFESDKRMPCLKQETSESMSVWLRYLDNEFKPEIELSDETVTKIEHSFLSKNQKFSSCFDEGKLKFSLSFSIHSCLPTFWSVYWWYFIIDSESTTETQTVTKINCKTDPESPRSIHSERRDVIQKNLIRSVRRYLWTQFSKMFDLKSIGKKKYNDIYKKKWLTFYNEFIKKNSTTGLSLSEEEHEHAWFLTSVILTNKYYYPTPNAEQTRVINLFKNITKRYSVRNYHKFIADKIMRLLFKMMKEGQIIDKIIQTNPKFVCTPEIYYKAFDDIINFDGKKPEFMK